MKMRVMAAITALFLTFALVGGCTSEVSIDGQKVPCIGAWDDEDPNYVYKAKGMNIAMAIIFFKLIVPPVVVLVDETLCPVRKTTKAERNL